LLFELNQLFNRLLLTSVIEFIGVAFYRVVALL